MKGIVLAGGSGTLGLKVACPEDITWRVGFISNIQIEARAKPLLKSDYGEYVMRVIEQERSGGAFSECRGVIGNGVNRERSCSSERQFDQDSNQHVRRARIAWSALEGCTACVATGGCGMERRQESSMIGRSFFWKCDGRSSAVAFQARQ